MPASVPFTLITILTLIVSSCTSRQEQQRQEARRPPPVVQSLVVDPNPSEPSIIITTHTLIQGTGCWANLYDAADFQGKKLTVYNAIDLPSLEFTGTQDWRGQVESVEVGPNSRIMLYERENYLGGRLVQSRGRSLMSLQGQELRNIGSLRLECQLR